MNSAIAYCLACWMESKSQVPAIREVNEEPFCLKHLLAEGHASNAGKAVNEQTSATTQPAHITAPVRAHAIRGQRVEQPRKTISKSEEKPMATWSKENTCRVCDKAGARIKDGICKKCARAESTPANAAKRKRPLGGGSADKPVPAERDNLSIMVSPSLIERLWATLSLDEKKIALEAVLCD